MGYDYSKLAGRIIEKFKRNSAFCDVFPMSRASLSQKLSGEREWTKQQMARCIELLSIPEEEVFDYFFTREVRENEHK